MYKYLVIFLLLCSSLFAREKLQLTALESMDKEIMDFAIEFTREALDKLGYDLEVIALPGERALIAANRGEFDGDLLRIKGAIRDYENLIPVNFNLMTISVSAYSSQNNLEIKDIKDIYKYNVVYIRGTKFIESLVIKNKTKKLVTKVNEFETAMKLINSKRSDIFISFERHYNLYKNKNKLERPIYKYYLGIPKQELNLYLHKKYADKIPAIEKAFKDLKEEGIYDEIFDKFGFKE